MKIVCLSDLHGTLPKVPDCDLLLIAGDICGPSHPELQKSFLDYEFRNWLDKIVDRDIMVAGVEGNHAILAKREPEIFRELMDSLAWHYLENDTFTLFPNEYGVKIFGHPGSLPFGVGWAFNYTEGELEKAYSTIDDDVDIIISHGPPYGIGDVPGPPYNNNPNYHTGSVSLLETIDRIRPKILVCGHIHGSYGVYEYENYDGTVTKIINASHMNEEYRPINKPILVEI